MSVVASLQNEEAASPIWRLLATSTTSCVLRTIVEVSAICQIIHDVLRIVAEQISEEVSDIAELRVQPWQQMFVCALQQPPQNRKSNKFF